MTGDRLVAERKTALLHGERQPEPAAVSANGAKGRQNRLLFGIVLVALVLGTGLSLWFTVLRERFVPKQFGVVVPGEVYRSGQISKYLIQEVIDRYHIGTIIDLSGLDPEFADQQAEIAAAQSQGIRLCRFPLRGNGTGDIEHFADAVEALVQSQRSGVPVLVHCAAGAQRTGACVSFYRLLVRGDSPESVYQELTRYGWNPHKDGVLLDYVNSHMEQLATLLVERHVLDRVPPTLPVLKP